MRKINIYTPPVEPFAIWDGGFTPQECETIIQLGELAAFRKASIGTEDLVNSEIRNTEVAWIKPANDTYWIFDRLNDLCGKINFDKFQMALDRFDGFQYSKYEVDGHYDWHIDTINSPPGGLFRKLSFVVMLTENDSYEGGTLLMNCGGDANGASPIRLQRGQVVAFYSHIPHKVEPVTRGVRVTLVTWALGPKFV